MNGKKVLVIVTVSLLALAGVYLNKVIRSRRQRIDKYDRAYEGLKIGDSRAVVVSAMGEPHEVTGCPYTPFADPKEEAEFRSKCFQEYEYVELMVRYTISFDRSGAVIYKSKAVSP